MVYVVIPTEKFKKDVKYYHKKFRSLKDDITPLFEELEKGNLLGDEISGLYLSEDESTYKVRVANSTAKVGKSNGFRIIYYVIKNEFEIYLLTMYYKKEKTTISNNEIIDIINNYCE